MVLPEGETKVVMQIIRERGQTLRRRKLNEVIGEIRCEWCDTREEANQGLQQKTPKEQIFEIHHLIPISQYDGAKITDLDEVALLCANYHRVIHTFPNDQIQSVDGFRQQLQKNLSETNPYSGCPVPPHTALFRPPTPRRRWGRPEAILPSGWQAPF